MKQYLKLMRVHHYIKNLLVFVALACSGQLFNGEKLFSGIVGFLAFCMVSSVVYIVNDIRDKEKDRNHPIKCRRPVAAGMVSVQSAWTLAALLLLSAAACSWLIQSIEAAFLLLLYLVLNLVYSFGLKNIPLVDVAILAAGFLIRILYGAYITGITVSNWLYLTVIVLAFYFSFGKRRNELSRISDGSTRNVLKEYPVNFLDKSMNMCLALANVFYALWSMDEKTVTLYNNRYLVLTVPIILLITMKYSLDIEGDSDDDPVEVLLHDKALLALCVFYFAVMFVILYVQKK